VLSITTRDKKHVALLQDILNGRQRQFRDLLKLTRWPDAILDYKAGKSYTEKKIPSKVRENGRESSLCGESMKIPSKVGNATLREKLPHNFVGISPSISE
jgi:hypothetical protein